MLICKWSKKNNLKLHIGSQTQQGLIRLCRVSTSCSFSFWMRGDIPYSLLSTPLFSYSIYTCFCWGWWIWDCCAVSTGRANTLLSIALLRYTQFLSMTHIISVTPTIYNFTFLQIPDWQIANTLGLFFLPGIFTSKSKGSQVSTKSRLKLINFPFPNNIA